MSLEQSIGAVIAALIGVVGGMLTERARQRREREKELNSSNTQIETRRIELEAQRRKEVDEAARDIREFLSKQVNELNVAIDQIEVARSAEREKWHQIMVQLSTKNLELELQHRRDMAALQECLEESQLVDNELKEVKTRLATCQSEGLLLKAKLEQSQLECKRLADLQRVI